MAEIRLVILDFRNISQENLLEALVAHPPRDGSGISSEAGNGHANVVVDG